MDAPHGPRRVVRRIGAVFAGMVAVVACSTATDSALRQVGIFPPPAQSMSDALFLLATAYRAIYSVASGYLTARLAPDYPVRHAVALGCVGLAASVVGAFLTWGRGPEFGPAWYSLALVTLALPCTWVGGLIGRGQRRLSVEEASPRA